MKRKFSILTFVLVLVVFRASTGNVAVTTVAEIDNIVLTFTQGGDGKEPKTGFRMGVLPGVVPGDNGEPMFTVYTCGTEDNEFAKNSTATIILTKNPKFKGSFDLATFQKAGGHLHIWPICYPAYSTSGIGYDLWDVTGISMVINLKPSPANPNPQPIGGAGGGLTWNLQGPGMVVLSSQLENQVDFYFDANFKAQKNN